MSETLIQALERIGNEQPLDDDGRCWKNRWHPTDERCTGAGIYGNTHALTTFDRSCRWCEKHAQTGDRRIGRLSQPRPQETR